MRRKVAGEPDTDTTRIDVKDFGPIRRGSIEIMPMTVLIGSNNSGKSYVSLLIRSMLGDSNVWRPRWTSKTSHTPIRKSVMNGNTFGRGYVGKVEAAFIEDLEAKLLRSVKRTFSDDLAQLIRIDARGCTIKIRTNHMTMNVSISSKKSTCKISPVQGPDIRLTSPKKKLGHGANGNPLTISSKIDRKLTDLITINSKTDRRLIDSVLFALIRKHFEPRTMFYFPAARSGILQGHEAISASIVEHAPYGGLEEIEIPKLPGVVADFIVGVIKTPNKQGHFYDIASNLEQEILQGEIKIGDGRPAFGIKYVYKQREIPVHLASSMVSEMAPFILHLKHTISEKSTLIIEEPEAHLHPHNQAIFAKYLVRLVRRGLKIILTTHSPFIVEQISNTIQAGNIAKSKRTDTSGVLGKNGWPDDSGLERDDYLDAKEVAAYEFVPSPSGYEIDRLDIEADDGIPVEEFVKVTQNIYRQSLAIRDRANNGS